MRETRLKYIQTGKERVILKKYSMIGDIGQFAKQYADALAQGQRGYLIIVTDRDIIIAASSGVKKIWWEDT